VALSRPKHGFDSRWERHTSARKAWKIGELRGALFRHFPLATSWRQNNRVRCHPWRAEHLDESRVCELRIAARGWGIGVPDTLQNALIHARAIAAVAMVLLLVAS
jgi:hypothetical protein